MFKIRINKLIRFLYVGLIFLILTIPMKAKLENFKEIISEQISDTLLIEVDTIPPLPLDMALISRNLKEYFKIDSIKNIPDLKHFTYTPNYGRLAAFGGVLLASGVYLHIYQSKAWWAEKDKKFRVVNDWDYALWIDKAGHFYATNLMAHGITSAFDASGFDPESGYLYGGLTALAYELFIEYEDGYGKDWGFSPGDAVFDALGAAFYISQYYYPFMNNFQPRWSYYPSEKFREGKHKGGIIIDDYEGQKYWMSFRVNNVLPKSVEKYWPDFLCMAIGIGVRDLDGVGGGIRDLYLGFDFDFNELPLYGDYWQFVKNTLNYFHLPMPGVRFGKDAAFFIFCY